MFKHIYTYELKYWLKKPAFYLYAIVFASIAFIAIVGTAGLFDSLPSTNNGIERLVNSPFELNYMLQYFNKFMLFLLPAIIGATIYKDYKNSTHSILYSFPIKKQAYLYGKFLSALTLVFTIALVVGLVIMIAEHIPGLHESKIGVFNFKGYLQALLVFVLPNLLFYGAIVFSVVTYSRNIYAGFIVIIVLFFLQNITENVFSGFLIALLDPFAQNAVMYETQYWTLIDKNTKLIPVFGTVLYNRLFWLTISTLIFSLANKSFTFTEHPIATFFSKQKGQRSTKYEAKRLSDMKLPVVTFNFSDMQQFKNAWSMSNMELKSIVKNWMFYIIVAFGILTVLFAVGKVTNNSEMNILPVTNIILTIPALFFITVIMLLTFIYSGMLVHKDSTSNMNQLVDASQISNFSLLASKVIAIIKMQALLLLTMMLAGIIIQVYNNYYHFEIGLYLFHLFAVQFVGLIIWAFASVFVHSLLKNTYLGIFTLIIGWLGISGLKEIGINTRLLLFNFSEPMQYSDLNVYGNLLQPYFLVKSYWFVFGIILLIITYLLWNRGVTESFKKRISSARSRFFKNAKIAASLSFIVLIVLGFTIYKEENKSEELSSKERSNAFNQFEKDFAKYSKIKNQPKITDMDLNIEIFPKSNGLSVNGSYILVNKSSKSIDTILVKTGFDEITEFTIDRKANIVDEDTYVKFSVLKLNESLETNDSIRLSFTLKNKSNTLFENNSNTLNNGTIFKNDILPRIGYFLNSNQKHPSDSAAQNTHYYSQDSDAISLKTVISTSNDQTAIAPGYLKKKWTENDRNYFKYETDSKIKNSLSFSSGAYEIKKEIYKDIDIEIYHHKNHVQNLSKMKEGLKAALEYNIKHFGPYQFTEARIIEFPITEGTYASVMANSIPTSEMRFIANTTDETIDISFYTMAHELTHQWWANQVVPADAFGAIMLSESITEYISLNIYEAQFGREKALQFLKMQRHRYLNGRVREPGIEPPLMLVEGGQQYLAYGKGIMSFNTLSHYMGKDKLHTVLKGFLNQYKDKGAPYPTSLDLVKTIKENTPDSLQYIIEDYFETVTFYDAKIEFVRINRTKNNDYEVILDFQFSKYKDSDESNELVLSDYMEIGFYNDKNEMISIKTALIKSKSNQMKFQLKEKPSKIILDPNLLLIEKDVKNNVLNP